MKRRITLELLCTVLALVFIYAGVSKLMDYSNFKVQLSKSPILADYANTVSWAVPVLELSIAAKLFVAGLREFALYAFLFLMSSFTIYLLVILNFSDHIPCSCGGILQKMSWEGHIIFNLAIITINLLAIYLFNKTQGKLPLHKNIAQSGLAENLRTE
ncbi:MauE/DoxX family redox-associated membrane protein [Pedobacter sp. UBA4863]|uniref:MauE/DoxX family redox-associated membrane protein n=1 Tax=Pedobacter sp. UBA4863 TaxID=1947060 RepID=UPI0025CE248B|nr:MauE/DoxX family redox-associated membrane protein [Pedobacter sp. UBA4863]